MTASPRIAFISLYCYKNFPVRIFHSLCRQEGADSLAVFLKNSVANAHEPVSEAELGLLADAIAKFNPDVIAISVLAPYVVTARKVVERLRPVSGAVVVVGGKYPTVDPEGALAFADYACRGEGENVLKEIFARLRSGSRDFTGITGLWHKGADGRVVDNGQQPLIQDMDGIPLQAVGQDGMLFIDQGRATASDPEAESPVIMLMAGRGCVYHCSYCVNSLLVTLNKGNGKFVRLRSPESVIGEIRSRLDLLPPQTRKNATVFFVDEVFGVFKEWTERFADLYGREIGLPFYCEMVPKLIKEDNIRLLAGVGLRELDFGIQSGVNEVRNGVFQRPGTNDELVEKAWILVRHGVKPRCDIILENPFETAGMMQETLRLLIRLPHPISMNVYKLQFFPEYPLTLEALKRGFISKDDLSLEKVAETTMTNWSFKPTVWSRDPKRRLEHAVFLIGWADNAVSRGLCRLMAAWPSPPVALLTGLLAVFFYRAETGKGPVARWMRRLLAAWELVSSGRVTELLSRVRRMAARA